MKNKTELLAPAGSYDSFVAAINAGADAVYAAGGKFGARAYADNLTQEQYLRAIDYAHMHGKKLYLTLNTLLKKEEFERELDVYLLPLYEHGLDGVIVQDVGVLSYLHKYYPDLPLHISTQMTVTGPDGAQFLKERGARRVVPARELSLEEIAAIRRETNMEVEVFVHGALCYCYSGQCFFSSLLGGRSGNRGKCAQPCRLPYQVNGKTGYFLSPKDLCALKLLPDLCEAGVDSFKIEGRMKSPFYTAGVVSVYRKYLDLYEADPDAYVVGEADLQYLRELFDRGGTTDGYFYRHNGGEMIALTRGEDFGVRGRVEAHEEDLKPLLKEQPAVMLDGFVALHCGQPATLSLWTANEAFGGGKAADLRGAHGQADMPVAVTVSEDVVQQAHSRPLREDEIIAQIQKTGGTFYRIRTLGCETDGAVFLPKQVLNRLRRDALLALDKQLLSPYRRDAADTAPEGTLQTRQEPCLRAAGGDNGLPQKEYRLAASVETEAQFEAAVASPYVSRIDIDSALITEENALSRTISRRFAKEADRAGKQLYLRFPSIFRKRQRARFLAAAAWLVQVFSGVIVRNIDAYAFCIGIGMQKLTTLGCDFTMYAFQNEAVQFFRRSGAASLTAPIELNSRELMQNRGLYDELVVYGRYPMMTSAGCVGKTLRFDAIGRSGCNHRENVLYLTDRYQKRFPVKNFCGDCCNVIYNSLPLSLLAQKQTVDLLDVHVLRMLFTVEAASETAQAIDRFGKVFLCAGTDCCDGETTRGHFKRGVE